MRNAGFSQTTTGGITDVYFCSTWTDDGLVVGRRVLVNRNHTFATLISFTRRLKKTFSKNGIGQCNVRGFTVFSKVT